jgi:hypothetical protein
MSISNEEYYEELLYNAHHLGIHDHVLQLASSIRTNNESLDLLDAYATAFHRLTEYEYPKFENTEHHTH